MIKLRFAFVLVFLFVATIVFSQFPSLPSNLSNIKSSDVTEDQVIQMVTYMQQNHITSQQAYDLMVRRGMNTTEAGLLKTRIDKTTDNLASSNQGLQSTDFERRRISPSDNRLTDSITNKTVEVKNSKKIFGLEIFNNGVLSFEPNLQLATPVDYIIGPGDEININIYGYQEAKYSAKVGPDGDINIPYVGVMYVAGLSIEQATAKIKSKLAASGYSNIRTGLTKVNVTLGRIRSIKIFITGEANKPGSYTLPSLATVFNALYLSGGPTENGSMRDIQLVRNGKVVDHLDVYDFLVKGDQTGNISLRDQDVIRIPAYKTRVSLGGQVKRAGLYEIKEGESLQSLLDFAGGFSDSAYTASITAYKLTDIERKISDIDQSQFKKYKPSRSEQFVVKTVIGHYTNKVTIAGAVYIPGDYELKEGMTVKDLIQKARGLKEDAYGTRGLILRRKQDLSPEFVAFSPANVMSSGEGNVKLKANDSVTISSVGELKENFTVSIFGEVRNIGVYPYIDSMSLKDLILLSGGFSDAAIPQRIEVGRRLRKSTFDIKDVQVSEVFDITSIDDLNALGNDIILQPYDAVVVRKNPGYQTQVNVRMEGEVVFPGPYVLKNKNERISAIIQRAGGLTLQAFPQGAYLTRINNKTVGSNLSREKIGKLQEFLKDTTGRIAKEVDRPTDQIALDLQTIMKQPGGRNDLILEEGDVITIPKEKMDVRISGQVLFPTRVVFNENYDINDYLGQAGGVGENARKSKIYVLYPNGNAAKTSHFLFFRSYPPVTPGSEVIVPKRHEVERRRLSTGEVIGIATAITSFAGVLLSLLININK